MLMKITWQTFWTYYMALVLKQNYRLEDLLFDQAARLEKEGNVQEAASKLDDALNADTVQKKSLERIKQKIKDAAPAICPADFRAEFENISLFGERIFYPIRSIPNFPSIWYRTRKWRPRWNNN